MGKSNKWDLLIESGIVVLFVTLVYFVGARANTIDEHEKKINALETEQKQLSSQVLTELGDIKGDIKVLMRRNRP